jgi:hypothetical protein
MGRNGVNGKSIGVDTGLFNGTGGFGDKIGGVGRILGADRIGVPTGVVFGIDGGGIDGAGGSDICFVGVLVPLLIPFPFEFEEPPIVPIIEDMPFPALTGGDEIGGKGATVGLSV